MRKIIKELAGWLVYIVIVVIIAWGFVTFVAQRTQVSGSSMETTLSDGDQLIVDKISYQFREPERFEIIVFPYQYEAGTYYIKRIIGLPGETVQILDGSVYINGEKLEEHYGNEVMEEAGIAAEPVTLGVDEYFVLGDNRNNSKDSRSVDVGVVHGKDFVAMRKIRTAYITNFSIESTNCLTPTSAFALSIDLETIFLIHLITFLPIRKKIIANKTFIPNAIRFGI